MRLTSRSSLRDVAATTAGALAAAGIDAVLTGGACASLYSDGEYQSSDLDFVLRSAATRGDLDAAMATIGFRRSADRYVRPEARFFVEFPPGPLRIGADIALRPVTSRIRSVTVKLLSPTDSCRDRLLAFYHWNDWQSLEAALGIARRRRENLRAIREWSAKEAASREYLEFLRLLRRGSAGARAARATGSRRTPKRKSWRSRPGSPRRA